MAESTLRIYTDGSCSPNPGPGGWAAVLVFDEAGKVVELKGSERDSTNNRMELTAAMKALESLSGPATVELVTDSRYLQDGITKWLATWRRRGWTTVEGQDVKNRDLWERLDASLQRHQVRWSWVKGHAEDTWNNRADELAGLARRQGAAVENRTGPASAEAVHIYTGVTWRNSTGNGSWAIIMVYRNHYKVLGGVEEGTTANRLYLQAVINAVDAMKRVLPLQIHTGSGYLRDGLTRWLDGWQRNGWRTRQETEISNREQWQDLWEKKHRYTVTVAFEDDGEPPCLLQEAKVLAREYAAELTEIAGE